MRKWLGFTTREFYACGMWGGLASIYILNYAFAFLSPGVLSDMLTLAVYASCVPMLRIGWRLITTKPPVHLIRE
jgi:hypothetical protein